MFMLISNEPIRVAHLQKLANQSMVDGALVMEMVTILLVKAKNILVVWLIEERCYRKKWNKVMGSEKIISNRFCYILSYLEVQKNRKVDNV